MFQKTKTSELWRLPENKKRSGLQNLAALQKVDSLVYGGKMLKHAACCFVEIADAQYYRLKKELGVPANKDINTYPGISFDERDKIAAKAKPQSRGKKRDVTGLPYKYYLDRVDWRKPEGRGRTLDENRAAIAKVDELVAETGCSKTEAFNKINLSFGTYYEIKKKDGLPPTPDKLVASVNAANNGGGNGKPKGGWTHTLPIAQIQRSLSNIQHEMGVLQGLGIRLNVEVKGA